MPTFIDESGDTGQIKAGGKPYFRLAAVWVPTLEETELFGNRLSEIRHALGLRRDYEFKFAKTHGNDQIRRQFFTAALEQEFRFAVSLIDKTEPYWEQATSQNHHWVCATELAALLRPIYYQAEDARISQFKEPIIVDDNRDRDFLNLIKTKFRELKSRKFPGSPVVGRVHFRDSSSVGMLQLVDMVCGAVGAHVDDGNSTWYEMIRERNVESRLNIQRERR